MGVASRIRKHYHEIYDRDRKLVMGVDAERLSRLLKRLFLGVLVLNVFDVATTLLGLAFVPGAYEQNPLFASLLGGGHRGVLMALLAKFGIVTLLSIVVYVPLNPGRFELAHRVVKLGILVAMLIAVPFYVWVVFFNNLPPLFYP